MFEGRRWIALLLVSLFLVPGATFVSVPLEPPVIPVAFSEESNSSANETITWDATVPRWRVGDLWRYDVVLDAVALVEGSSELQGAELDFLYGDATMIVEGVEEIVIDGEVTPVYRTLTEAFVVGAGRDFPAPIIGTVDGTLEARMTLVEYHRVGDLALVEFDKNLVMEFVAVIAFVEERVDVADFTDNGVYSPPLEFYDFPATENESWNQVTNLTINTTGSSTVGQLLDEPQYLDQEWSFETHTRVDDSFQGCDNSTSYWMYDSAGEPEEERIWCQSVSNFASRWTDDIALGGVNATMNLSLYQPSSSGFDVMVEMEPDESPLNAEVDVWVNVTGEDGSPVSGESGFLYTSAGRHTFTTDSNGSAFLRLGVGNAMDDTPTADDWGTHGFVAYFHSEQAVGVSTMTLEGSAIGGLLRAEAGVWSAQASAIMALHASRLESSLRY